MTTVLGTESHKCDECPEAYQSQHQLRKHKAEEHPKYKCGWPGCKFVQSRKAMMIRHQLQAHCGENSVACSVTGCQYVVPYVRLANHMQEEHGDEEKVGEESPQVEEGSESRTGRAPEIIFYFDPILLATLYIVSFAGRR